MVVELEKSPGRPLPKKGEQFPSHWEAVDLPEPGAKPVDLCGLSPRCRAYLENFRELMLKKDWKQAL